MTPIEQMTASPEDRLADALDNAFVIATEINIPAHLFTARWNFLQTEAMQACDALDLPWEEHLCCLSRLPTPFNEDNHVRCIILVSPLFVTELEKRESRSGPTDKAIWIRLQEAGLVR